MLFTSAMDIQIEFKEKDMLKENEKKMKYSYHCIITYSSVQLNMFNSIDTTI